MKKWEQFEEYVEQLMQEENIPGVAVGLTLNGEPLYSKGFGVADLKTNELVTADSIFGIASITKSFTAVAIMKLVEEGKIQLNNPVINYLPNFKLKNYDNIEKIHVHHLLSHTAGIAGIERKEHLTNFDEHLDYLSETDFHIIGEPGEMICYHNDLFLLLGAIIEKVTATPYQMYIKNLVFEPLEMNRTTYNLSELQNFNQVTTPYILENKLPTECAWPTLGNYTVGGGIRSSVNDLLKYGQLYTEETNIINPKYIKEMYKPVYPTHGKTSYGYALQSTATNEGITYVEHGGGQPGVSSNFGFIPEKGLVGVVLTNIGGVSAKKIWKALMDTALDLPIGEPTHPTTEEFQVNQNQFVGTYTSMEGSILEVSVKNNQMVATLMGETHPLQATGETTFIVSKIDQHLRFYKNEQQEIWGLLIGLREKTRFLINFIAEGLLKNENYRLAL